MRPGIEGARLATDIAGKCLHKDRARQIIADWIATNAMAHDPADVIEELSACIHVLAVNYLASAGEMLADDGYNLGQLFAQVTAETRRNIADAEPD